MENRVTNLIMVSNQVSFPFLHNVLFFLDLITFWLFFGLLRFIIDMSPIEPQPFSPIAKISWYVEIENMFYQISLVERGFLKAPLTCSKLNWSCDLTRTFLVGFLLVIDLCFLDSSSYFSLNLLPCFGGALSPKTSEKYCLGVNFWDFSYKKCFIVFPWWFVCLIASITPHPVFRPFKWWKNFKPSWAGICWGDCAY